MGSRRWRILLLIPLLPLSDAELNWKHSSFLTEQLVLKSLNPTTPGYRYGLPKITTDLNDNDNEASTDVSIPFRSGESTDQKTGTVIHMQSIHQASNLLNEINWNNFYSFYLEGGKALVIRKAHWNFLGKSTKDRLILKFTTT